MKKLILISVVLLFLVPFVSSEFKSYNFNESYQNINSFVILHDYCLNSVTDDLNFPFNNSCNSKYYGEDTGFTDLDFNDMNTAQGETYLRVTGQNSGGNPYAGYKINFVPDESKFEIDAMNITISIVSSGDEYVTAKIYIWNYSSFKWQNLSINLSVQRATSTDFTLLNYYLTSNHDFFDSNNNLSLLIADIKSHDSAPQGRLDFDYIDFNISYNPNATPTFNSYCYQETANETGENGCGFSNGNYTQLGASWTTTNNLYDGDYASSTGSSGSAIMHSTYLKPSNADTNTLVQFNTSGNLAQFCDDQCNQTIISSCWDYGDTSLITRSRYSSGVGYMMCWDGDAQVIDFWFGEFYEEGIYWSLSQNISQNHNSSFRMNFPANDADGDGVSYWINDTSLFSIDENGTVTGNPDVSDVGYYQYIITTGDGNSNTTQKIYVNITNTGPSFDNPASIYNIEQSHNATYSIDVNATDAEGDTISYWLNDTTIFDIDSSGIITGNPSISDVANHSILVIAGDIANNKSLAIWINVTNTAPTISGISINNTSPADTDDLLCEYSSSNDADNDPLSYNYKWFNDSLETSFTDANLSAVHTSIDDEWYCQISATDSVKSSPFFSSSVVVIGSSSSAPTVSNYNATTNGTGVISNATFPTNNNLYIQLEAEFSDAQSDKVSAYWCKTGDFNGQCQGGQWGNSSEFSVKTYDSIVFSASEITTTVNEYYLFLKDNNSLFSSASSGEFHVNHRPTVSIINSTIYTNSNMTWIGFSESDSDSDSISLTLFNSTKNNPFSILDIFSGTSYQLNETREITYVLKIRGEDEHGYNSTNSSTINVTFDFTNPNGSLNSPNNNEIEESRDFLIQYEFDDNVGLDTCAYELRLRDFDTNVENVSLTCTDIVKSISVPESSDSYKIRLYTYDLAGNYFVTNFTNFTIEESGSSGGGGGGGDDDSGPVNGTDILNICGNNICEEGEFVFTCPQDCTPAVGDVTFSDLTFHCFDDDPATRCIWQEAGFTASMFLILLVTFLFIAYQSQTTGNGRLRLPKGFSRLLKRFR